jgi:uncharacterized protein (TIGR00369 family)
MTEANRSPAARIAQSFARQGLMTTFGASIALPEPGLCEITLPYCPAVTQQHGFVHAGAIAAVLDSACGYAALSVMPDDTGVLTVEFKINLMAPAKGRTFLARGRVLRAGRTLLVTQGECFADGSDRPLALITATIMSLPASRGLAD